MKKYAGFSGLNTKMRILQCENESELTSLMQTIGVDPYGAKIMAPKAAAYIIRLNDISNVCANILKQELLAIGADAAIARGALTGKTKKTDCLLFLTASQLKRVCEKLNRQPFGLKDIAWQLRQTLKNYQKSAFSFHARQYHLTLGPHTRIMGIINLTPDSFSGDGVYTSAQFASSKNECMLRQIEHMAKAGADIIDIGGESSRPGAKPVPLKEELARVIPVLRCLKKRIHIPISVDTYKPEVAHAALDNGAAIINDITGLRHPKMAKIIARYRAGVVLMHMKASPSTMQRNPVYRCLRGEIFDALKEKGEKAIAAGIAREQIIIDPGIGFAKTMQHNLEIIKHLRELKSLGFPILVGPSRKAFIGKILNIPTPSQRLSGTLAAAIVAAQNGAAIIRVHDVKETKEALEIASAIKNAP